MSTSFRVPAFSALVAVFLVAFAVLIARPAPAFALSTQETADILDDTVETCEMIMQGAAGRSPAQRLEAYQKIEALIEAAYARCGNVDAEQLSGWGDLYVNMGKNAEDDFAFVFLDKAVPVFEKGIALNPGEEHLWTGLAEVHHERAERLYQSGDKNGARREAEAGFAVFKEGEGHCPDNNFLYYMWGSNLVLRAYDVENPERRALREEGIAKFARAAEIEPDDQYSLRMAGTAYMRIVDDLPDGSGEREGLLRKAESWYTRAFKEDPDGTCARLAECLAELKDAGGLRGILSACKRNSLPRDLDDNRTYDFVRGEPWFRELLGKR